MILNMMMMFCANDVCEWGLDIILISDAPTRFYFNYFSHKINSKISNLHKIPERVDIYK